MSDLVPLSVNQLDPESEVSGDLRLPAMSPSALIAKALTIAQLKGAGVTISASSAPSAGNDETTGIWPRWLWVRQSPLTVWICASATEGAAVWLDLTTASVTGLGNPLTESLNGNDHLIYSSPFAGFMDRYYNLQTDSGNLVDDGVAALTRVYNAFHHGALAEPLEVVLPAPHGSAQNAVFGMLSVKLADGGSVTLANSPAWAWEKASPVDADQALPTEAGAHFVLRYRWDPVAALYAVSVSHLGAAQYSEAAVSIVPDSWQVSSLPQVNKGTHAHTHEFFLDATDPSHYVLVGCFLDGTSAPSMTTLDCVDITSPPTGSGSQVQGWWWWYKPTAGDLIAGSKAFSVEKANEMGQLVSVEVVGADPTNPIGNKAHNRSTSDSRTTVAATPIATTRPNSLIIASASKDDGAGATVTAAVASANGFDTNINSPYGAVSHPVFLVNSRIAEEADTYDTPAYSCTGAGAIQMEAFVVQPPAP